MERKEIEEKVRNFLIEDLEIDEENIAPEAKLKDDLGIDSLDFVDIVVIVEKNFGFKIKPEEMQGVVTLSQFCDYIESKVGYHYIWQWLDASIADTIAALVGCADGLFSHIPLRYTSLSATEYEP